MLRLPTGATDRTWRSRRGRTTSCSRWATTSTGSTSPSVRCIPGTVGPRSPNSTGSPGPELARACRDGTLFADSPYAEQFVWTLRKFGTDRVLFGSDYPLHSPTEALDVLRALGFTDDEQAQIRYGDAMTLLG